MTRSGDEPSGRRVRWVPLAVLAVGAAVAIAVVRAREDGDHQARNLTTAAIALGAGVLALVWLLGFARLRPAARRAVAAGGLAIVAIGAATVRIRGVTGDLVPVLEWRWASSGTALPGAATPDAAAADGLADWPQFLGPTRDCRVAGPELASDWDAELPTLLWRRAVGDAWSGFAVVGRRAVTQEQRGDDEVCACYDVLTGDELWADAATARYFTTVGGLGPRGTPTIAGGGVFALGATGVLRCVELATGRRVWSKDVLADNGAAQPEWGVAGSPLVVGDLVVVGAGGPDGRSVVAYRTADGTRAWSAGDDAAGYSSPVLAHVAGVDQVVSFNAASLTAHDPGSGRLLWSYPWPADHPHVCVPLVTGADTLLVSSGYGTGAAQLRIVADADRALAVERAWRSSRLKAKFTNIVTTAGCVFGLDDGILTCVDLADGRRRWKAGRYGHGQLVLAGDLLLVTTETGEVVAVEAAPDAHRELARFRAFDGKWWNPPALAGRFLVVRSDREAAVFRLPVRPD